MTWYKCVRVTAVAALPRRVTFLAERVKLLLAQLALGKGAWMRRRDWLLQLIDDEIDPIRIQKGMFLFAKESGAPEAEVYDFIPYNWGPCSFDIYDDLEKLHDAGLIERVPVPGQTWSRYRRTVDGESKAALVSKKVPDTQAAYISSVKEAVTSERSFNRLLRRVYKKYPEYATKSLWNG